MLKEKTRQAQAAPRGQYIVASKELSDCRERVWGRGWRGVNYKSRGEVQKKGARKQDWKRGKRGMGMGVGDVVGGVFGEGEKTHLNSCLHPQDSTSILISSPQGHISGKMVDKSSHNGSNQGSLCPRPQGDE